ncbi:MAG: hypothetical protein NVS4B3_10680 [Gemmatimonadaceae bacterium]
MKTGLLGGVWLCLSAAVASGQQRDTVSRRVPRPVGDSAARLDSLARADSLAAERELAKTAAGKLPTESPAALPQRRTQVGGGGAFNPRLLPDFSAVGDLVGDLSPNGSTQDDKTRFGVREVELAVQAAVDPFFRGDVFLGISDTEKISIEQAFLTTTALSYDLEARLGRYLMPFGKQNTTHRHDLHTVEYPYVLQRFLAADGLKGTGVYLSRIVAPFGFYQELQVTAVNRLGDPTPGLTPTNPVNKRLTGLAVSARFRNYVDISENTNFELSASVITGKREQAVGFAAATAPAVLPAGPLPTTDLSGANAVPARQSLFGVDLTYRWRPLQQGLYQSFLLQAEYIRQVNERRPSLGSVQSPLGFVPVYGGPQRDNEGAYAFARYQMSPRGFLGTRYDYVQDPQPQFDGRTLQAGSAYLEFFPSEFSKIVVAYERLFPSEGYKSLMATDDRENLNRILVQAAFSLGPHKPHPF